MKFRLLFYSLVSSLVLWSCNVYPAIQLNPEMLSSLSQSSFHADILMPMSERFYRHYLVQFQLRLLIKRMRTVAKSSHCLCHIHPSVILSACIRLIPTGRGSVTFVIG